MATIALFCASEQTHCTVVVLDSEWVIVALHSIFSISTKVVAVLFSCYMAGSTWNCWHLDTSSVAPYNHAPVYSVTVRNHICRKHVFSCYPPPALLAEWLQSFTCYCSNITWGWSRYWTKSQHSESWPWRTKFSFDHESVALSIPTPWNK